jgi:hypothetical protein
MLVISLVWSFAFKFKFCYVMKFGTKIMKFCQICFSSRRHDDPGRAKHSQTGHMISKGARASPGALFRATIAANKPLQVLGTINAYTALQAEKEGRPNRRKPAIESRVSFIFVLFWQAPRLSTCPARVWPPRRTVCLTWVSLI